MSSRQPSVLCIDDDPAVLTVFQRVLGPRYDVTTAASGSDAIAAVQYRAGFAVVISDLHLPDLDGVAVLSEVERLAPQTVRLLVSGRADVENAIAAINKGHVFRFLQKPFDSAALIEQVGAACAQHELLLAERAVLEQTVQGAVQAMAELVALSSPVAHGHGARLHRLVADLAALVRMRPRWEVEVAALLSPLGYLSLPADVVARHLGGEPLDAAEQAQVGRLPAVTDGLLASIPRFEGVREILRHQAHRFDGEGSPPGPRRAQLPLGARILRLATDFDLLQCRGRDAAAALAEMRAREGVYDPALLREFEDTISYHAPGVRTVDLMLRDVDLGMVFAEDVIAPNGVLLVARGQDVTRVLMERIHGHWSELSGTSRLRMIVAA